MITNIIKHYIDKSVLCWLATVDKHNEPNVSPKEMFTYKDDTTLLIANVASPNSVDNIVDNPKVCVSFLDVFVQKGYKLKGSAKLITKSDQDFHDNEKILTQLFGEQFPIQSIIAVDVNYVASIHAPRYFLFADTTEQSQIESAMRTYHVKPMN